MKTLQSDLTTPVQSKRLLELGVPADSANLSMTENGKNVEVLDGIIYSEFIKRVPQNYSRIRFLPCWSVGRLIEIYITCIEHYTDDERLTFGQVTVRLGMIDCIIAAIEVGCDDGDISFSKLED